jgi:isoleucyl-tRNA synthetase
LNFCNIDLSAFYLDIAKDKLYCSGPTLPRISSQTAIFLTLRSLLSLLGPVLSFTTEEAYLTLVREILHPAGVEAEESVHLTDFPDVDASMRDEALAEMWDTLVAVRRDVLKPIEELRIGKTIGHSLESEVTLFAEGETYDLLKQYSGELAQLFVVSRVTLEKKSPAVQGAFRGELVDVKVAKSSAQKCARCWRYLESVGTVEDHADLCERCASVVDRYYSDAAS